MPRPPILVALALTAACGAQPGPGASGVPAARTVTLSIVSTNDVHGQLERLPVVAGFVDNLRAARRRDGGVLLVDAGDTFQGTIESSLDEGAGAFAALGAMGCAALALGNHEFDFGPQGPASVSVGPGDDPQGALRARVAAAPFPVLAANLVGTDGARPAWKNLSPSVETTVAGIRVGIVGLLTEDAPAIIKRPNFAGLAVEPLALAAAREATLLRHRGAEVVVVVAHAGGECHGDAAPEDVSGCDPNSELFRLARALPPGLVDVIFGGHRNSGVAKVVAGIPVAHAPSHLAAFSRVDLLFDPVARRVTARRILPPHAVCTRPLAEGCAPGDYEGAKVTPDAAVTAAIAPSLAAARAERDAPVGVTVEATFPLERRSESALGNLFADLMREAVPGADGAFANAGSLRDVLPAGTLTRGQLHHVMPFDNQLAEIRLTAGTLRAIVRRNVVDASHGALSLAGVRAHVTCGDDGPRVELRGANGAPLADDAPLLLVTSDFLALGGDGLLPGAGVRPEAVTLRPGTVEDALVAGLARRGHVSPGDRGLLDPAAPRLALPGPWPVRCASACPPP